jgi:hypothetical protein
MTSQQAGNIRVPIDGSESIQKLDQIEFVFIEQLLRRKHPNPPIPCRAHQASPSAAKASIRSARCRESCQKMVMKDMLMSLQLPSQRCAWNYRSSRCHLTGVCHEGGRAGRYCSDVSRSSRTAICATPSHPTLSLAILHDKT